METAGGGEVPAELVRAGQWVQVGTDSGPTALPPAIILTTSFEAKTEHLTAQLGYWGIDYSAVLFDLFRAMNNLASGTQPMSGARLI